MYSARVDLNTLECYVPDIALLEAVRDGLKALDFSDDPISIDQQRR